MTLTTKASISPRDTGARHTGLPHRTVALVCHPDCRSESVRGIDVHVYQISGGALAFTYILDAELARLRIPPPRPPRRMDGLWRHTCFEAFVALDGEVAYREFNFAPSGEWAAYAFGNYRDGAPLARDIDPRIAVRRGEDRLELDAVMDADFLPPTKPGVQFRLALSAVIEEQSGALSYWALKHPPGRPDFHHPEAFALGICRTWPRQIPDAEPRAI